jgi:hypothetical protein
MVTMKKINLFLLVALFLTSCATPATPEPTQTLTPEPTSTQTPTQTSTSTPTPTPTITPTPTQVGGGAGRLVFVYSDDEYGEKFPNLTGGRHVFVANIDGTNLMPITRELEEFNLVKDVSPDGTKILVTSSSGWRDTHSDLYLVNLNSLDSKPVRLAKGLPNENLIDNLTAKWIDDTKIIYIGQGEAGFGIYIINADGTDPVNIERNSPFEILAVSKERVYWATKVTKNLGGNRSTTYQYIWWTSLDGTDSERLTLNEKQMVFQGSSLRLDLAFSPDGEKIAWLEGATSTFHHNYLYVASVSDLENAQVLDPEPITNSINLKWLNDSKVLVYDASSVEGRLDYVYDTTSIVYGLYEIFIEQNLEINNYRLSPEIIGAGDSTKLRIYDVSSDGRLLLCITGAKNAEGDYVAKLNSLNLETKVLSELSGFDFLLTNGRRGMFWIP